MITKILLGAAVLLAAVAAAAWIANSTASGGFGLVNGSLAPCPDKPNCVSSLAADQAHLVAPIPFGGASSPAEALDRVRRAAAAMPGAEIAESEGAYLRFTFTSRIFRFVDDVEFLADDANRVIHVRSASRVGHSDLGVNRRRVEEIRTRAQTVDLGTEG